MLASTLLLFVIVATGATVRLTGSGLGCEGWPGCEPGRYFPEKDYHAFIEFGNRGVGGVTIALTLLAWLAAWRAPAIPSPVTRTAFGVFAGTAAQAPLGALVVATNLHPLLVMPHLLLSIAVLGAAVVASLYALGLRRGTGEPYPRALRRLGLALVAGSFGVIVSGAFVTAAGPHSGGEAIARFGSFAPALYVHGASVAVFGCALMFLLGYLAAAQQRSRPLFLATASLAGLVLLQMGVGEIQYQTELPWWLVLVHVTLAAGVWAATVALVTQLYRPLGPFATGRA